MARTEKKPTGPSFPFMNSENGNFSMAYDSIQIEKTDKQLTLTYYNEEVPIFAYTIDMYHDEFTATIDGHAGKINFGAILQ